MMTNPLIQDLLSSLGISDYDVVTLEEDFKTARLELNFDGFSIPQLDEFKQRIHAFPERDNLQVYIMEESLLSRGDEELKQFLEDIEYILEDFDTDDNIKNLKIRIDLFKHVKANRYSIYFLDKFFESLNTSGYFSVLTGFDGLISISGDGESESTVNEYIVFDLLGETGGLKPFYTKTFYFIPSDAGVSPDYITEEEREDTIRKFKEHCNFVNNPSLNLIPEDFDFIKKPAKKNNLFNRLKLLFDKIKTILALTYISDISERVNGTLLDVKINGLKTIHSRIDLGSMKDTLADSLSEASEYHRIYSWVYLNNIISDQIDIARNIISIHIKDNDNIFLLEESTYKSVQSAFEVYRKGSVKEYFEVVDRIFVKIDEIRSRVNKNLSDYIGGLLQQILFSITFFFSIVILNAVSGGNMREIFYGDITLISYLLIGFGVVYAVVAFVVSNLGKKELKKEYDNLIQRFKNYLDEDKIHSILYSETESPFKPVNTFIMWLMFVVWILVYSGMFLVIWYLSGS
jgi:hypothetical protein